MNCKLIQVQEHKMYVNLADMGSVTQSLLKSGVYDSMMTKTIKNTVKPGMVAVDIGAHIGYFTLIMAKYVGKSGSVYAFEPASNNFALLQRNILENNYQNIKPFQLAVSDKVGERTLFVSANSHGSNSFVPNHVINASPIKVKVINLNSFFKGYKGRLDFIKIDVEGAELAVLKGMSGIIKKNPNLIIICEFAQHTLRSFGSKPVDLLRNLVSYGFKIRILNEETQSVEKAADIPALLRKYTAATNILARK